ncbi:MAG TPA: outer membrane beta-barrel protein [Spirochaetia bacterium]|nr:outer membrane beta-barrel protein [Spirochaetia bacterium]
MRKILLAAVLAAILVVSVSAESAVIDSKGAFGLQFSVGGLGNFGAGAPTVTLLPASSLYGIGGKYFVADKFGLGLTLAIGGDDDAGTDTQTFWFGFRPALTYTLAKKGPVALYTGGYLSLGIEKTTVAGASSSTNAFAFGGNLGAEWAIASQVSLAAEYALGVYLFDGYTVWTDGATRAYLTFYF